MVWEEDLKPVRMETQGGRIFVDRLPDGRYYMLHYDVYHTPGYWSRSVYNRINLALHFSRTGDNDFVAGPSFLPDMSTMGSYPQSVVHDGKLYIAYTEYTVDPPAWPDRRGIRMAVVNQLPGPDKFYLWPRDKQVSTVFERDKKEQGVGHVRFPVRRQEYVYKRPYLDKADGRDVVVFKDCGTAGVEIDALDFGKGERLRLEFAVKVLKSQEVGNLIFCSFGDTLPIRIGIPGNRPGQIYAQGRDDWEKVGALPENEWAKLSIEYGADEFTIAINDGKPQTFINPMRYPARRLYLGDGYEVDRWESNRGSEFLIDLGSVRTHIAPATRR